MQLQETLLPGCFILEPPTHRDQRGHFVKWFNSDVFSKLGLCVNWAEVYASVSTSGVVRGLHFQVPPFDHAKLVFCLSGRALDVVLDLRRGSQTYGKHIQVRLSSDQARALYVPSGCAHGFLSEVDQTLMVYQVSSPYSPRFDSGVRWDSAGIDWPVQDAVVSERDAALPGFDEFDSPFRC